KGVMNWKQGFVSGAMLSVLIAIISPLVQFFIYHYISPDYFQNMIDYQPKNGMPLSGAKELYSMKFFMIQAVFTDLSFWITFSAIIAFILQKQPEKGKKGK